MMRITEALNSAMRCTSITGPCLPGGPADRADRAAYPATPVIRIVTCVAIAGEAFIGMAVCQLQPATPGDADVLFRIHCPPMGD